MGYVNSLEGNYIRQMGTCSSRLRFAAALSRAFEKVYISSLALLHLGPGETVKTLEVGSMFVVSHVFWMRWLNLFFFFVVLVTDSRILSKYSIIVTA